MMSLENCRKGLKGDVMLNHERYSSAGGRFTMGHVKPVRQVNPQGAWIILMLSDELRGVISFRG